MSLSLLSTRTTMYALTVARSCLGWLSILLCASMLPGAEPAVRPAAPETPYVVFLGTGAADVEKAKTDACPNCTYIREHGGRNARRHAALFVSPDVVIDYTVTGREGLQAAGIAPSAVNYLLITHSHGDHFKPAAIVELAREKGAPLAIVGNAHVVAAMEKLLKSIPAAERPAITLRTIKPFEEFDVGSWHAKSLAANHAPTEEALIYVLRGKQGSLLYATDTGWFPDETFKALQGEKFDLAIVEGTFGDGMELTRQSRHMTFPLVRQIRQSFVENGQLKLDAPFLLTHLSLHYCEPYDTIAPRLAKEGIVVAYDGLLVPLHNSSKD